MLFSNKETGKIIHKQDKLTHTSNDAFDKGHEKTRLIVLTDLEQAKL